MQKTISIDKDKCIHCGLCIKDCLLGCIEFDNDKIPRFKEGAEASCISCQHCFAVCPTGALSYCGKDPSKSSKVSYGNPEEVLNLIKSRRSVRYFKKENIPQDKLQKLKEMLPYSPTGCNVDSLHFSFIETKEKMDEIRELTYKKIIENNISIPSVNNLEDVIKSGNDLIYRGATAMVVVAVDEERIIKSCENVDPIIALSYLDIYAPTINVGTVWCGFATAMAQQIPELCDMFEIPTGYRLNYVMLLGTPDIEYTRTIQPEPFSIKEIR
ncbi:nitroreductase family protein [bacterium]|nr:nitroreductase family protein [bacterium]